MGVWAFALAASKVGPLVGGERGVKHWRRQKSSLEGYGRGGLGTEVAQWYPGIQGRRCGRGAGNKLKQSADIVYRF